MRVKSTSAARSEGNRSILDSPHRYAVRIQIHSCPWVARLRAQPTATVVLPLSGRASRRRLCVTTRDGAKVTADVGVPRGSTFGLVYRDGSTFDRLGVARGVDVRLGPGAP